MATVELWDLLTQASALNSTQVVIGTDRKWVGSRAELHNSARRSAASLRASGMEPGDVVACIMSNSAAAMAGLLGIWWTGAAAASLPIPARGMSRESYERQIRRLVAATGSRVLLVEERFLGFLRTLEGADSPAQLVSYESLLRGAATLDPHPLPVAAIAYIQFSSGATGEPKGVALTAEAISAQLMSLARGLEVDPEVDRAGSWSPLSHDMGLFSWLMCWSAGVDHLKSAPERFVSSPRTWLDDCADFGVTLTSSPPFGLELAARANRGRRSVAAGKLRCCLVGADRLERRHIHAAVEALASRGLTERVITPAYGLAEATLAVTLGDLHEPPATVTADGSELIDGRLERVGARHCHAQAIVSAGRPLPGFGVRIDGTTADWQLGEICARGPSLASHYFGDPKLTATRFQNGEVRTGDVGFTYNGQLYVLGRIDDVLVVGGRNIHATEIERILESDRRIRQGAIAIIDLRTTSGRRRFVAVAETATNQADPRKLATDLQRVVMQNSGVALDECLFLSRGSFPRTPSGKPQRFRCRAIASRPPADAARVALRLPV